MDEIVRDGRQRSETVSQGSEDETGHKRLASHVMRRYVAANWLANGILADHSCQCGTVQSGGNFVCDPEMLPCKGAHDLNI
jgi:hypothetical protein